MQFPQKFCPLCDEQVIASTLGQIRINFTCIFKVFPKMPSSRENFENKSEINSFNKLLRFPFRWRLSSYFPCVNSSTYNWRFPFKCKLATKGPKQKWRNEKALMFLVTEFRFFKLNGMGSWTGEKANSRISSFTSTPSADICPPCTEIHAEIWRQEKRQQAQSTVQGDGG